MRGFGRWIAVAGAACGTLWAAAPAVAQTYPAALEGEALTSWLRRETDITPQQVVAVSPSTVTAVISTYPSVDPLGLRVVLRAEAVSALAQSRDGVLSWHVSVQTDCAGHRVRMGETTGYKDRNLIGDGRMIRPLETQWRTALPGTPLDAVWRLACDRTFRRPLAPQMESIALAGSAGAIKTAPREIRAIEPPPSATPSSPPPAAPPRTAPPIVRTTAPAPPPRSMPTRPTAALPPPTGGGAVVQIIAAGSQAEAQRALDGLRVRFARQVDGRRGRIEPVQTDGRTLYRALVTGFGSRAEAVRACEGLKAGGQACFVRAGG